MKIQHVLIQLFATLLLVSVTSSAFAISTYHIGNSLSWDAITSHGLKSIFTKGGVTLTNNYHIRCGSSLDSTLGNSGDACLTSADGAWDVALKNNQYDYLILQPHENTPSTQAEISAMHAFTALTTAQLVIYEAYPGFDDAADLFNYYLLPNQSDFRQTQAEFLKISSSFPNAVIIPAMQVLIEIDALARSGKIPGISTAQDLYRDSRHLNDYGRYILGLAHFSALTGLDPGLTGLDLNSV